MKRCFCGTRGTGRALCRARRLLVSIFVVAFSCGLLGVWGAAQDNTSTTIQVSPPDPVCVGDVVTLTVTVANTSDTADPTGTVDVSITAGSGLLSSASCSLTGNGNGTSSCAVDYTPDSAETSTHEIAAEYAPDDTDAFNASQGSVSVDVEWCTVTTVMGSPTPVVVHEPTIVVVTVSEPWSARTPSGTVELIRLNSALGALNTSTATLDAAGRCEFVYTPADGDTTLHGLRAEYTPTGAFRASEGIFYQDVIKRAADVAATLGRDTADVGEAVAVYVLVEDDSTAGTASEPTGTVTFADGGKGGTFNPSSATLSGGTCSVTYTPAAGAAGTTVTITAEYTGSSVHAGKAASTALHVNQLPSDTTLTLATAPNPSVVGEEVTLTATATAETGRGSPTGTVTFSVGTTTLGSAALTSSGTDESKATLTTTLIPVGTHTITATYPGDDGFNGSTATATHTVEKRSTVTRVFGSDTALVVGDTVTGTVTVTSAGSVPTGEVTLTVNPDDEGSPILWTHTLNQADGGQFTFTYTPASAADTPHVFTAVYAGDGSHKGSTGSFEQAIIKRATDVQLILDPPSTFINQPITIKVLVEDNTTAGLSVTPQGTVTFDDGGKNGAFSESSLPLDHEGRVTVTYTPAAHDAGMTTITATYADEDVHVHKGRARDQLLTVNLRPTEVTWKGPSEAILVQQPESYTVTVTDISGATDPTPPAGTLEITKSLAPTGEGVVSPPVPPLVSAPPDSSQAEFLYWRTRLDLSGDFDVLLAVYEPNDGIHALSGLGFAQAINRRFTKTELDCLATPTGYACTVTVKDDPSNKGTPSIPQGRISDLSSGDTLCTLSAGTCSFSGSSSAMMANVTVQYEPNESFGVHMTSTASENVDRAVYVAPGATGDPASPPANAVNIREIMMQQTKACGNAEIAGFVLDGLSIGFGFVPDPIIGAGFGVISGTTIPLSDILQAITDLASLALDIYISIACSDTDGDGLYDLIEKNIIGTDPELWDTDGDGLGDGEEIDMAGGWFGGSACPSPLNPDSDGDGLMDGWESMYGTDPCNPDTDGDGVGDGIEVSTRLAPTPEHGFVSPLPVAIGPCPDTFFPGFTDHRMWSSPLLADTDGDGLSDWYEIGKSCSPTGDYMTYGPFVAKADSDGDGLSDYEEVTAGGARSPTRDAWSEDLVTIGDSFSSGEGWTDPCNWDTDGDGLSDGAEVGLWGWSVLATTEDDGVVTTVAALDYDMDRDGLLDGPEHMVYGTDPLHWDTDGDKVSDAIEVSTSIAPAEAAGFSMAKVADTGYGDGPDTFFAGFTDPRMWSNPLIADTDGDGLSDWYEIGKSCAPAGLSYATYGPFVAMADSDGDGLSDHAEVTAGGLRPLDLNPDPTANYSRLSWSTDWVTIGDSWGPGSGWLDPCNPDTDGDGLADGVEVGLWGWQISATIPDGTSVSTVAALDDDMDQDGLSDFEEHNTTATDPLHWDTDRDRIGDADELIAIAGAWPNRHFEQASDPLSPNTDGDYLDDWEEWTFNPITLAFDLYPGTRLGDPSSSYFRNLGGDPDTICPFVHIDDSDNDGVLDGATITRTVMVNDEPYTWTFVEGFEAVPPADVSWEMGPGGTPWMGIIRTVITPAPGRIGGSLLPNVCNPDSDGDGLLDGQEVGLGTDPGNWDSDGDGLPDGFEAEIGTSPFDADSDKDGLLDSAEVLGSNPTNPLVADTDGDGLCDGGARTPYMLSGHVSAVINPVCLTGIGGHPNPLGIGENERGDGTRHPDETDPNNPDTDGDGVGDGIEVLGFSVNRQHLIPTHDSFGRPILVTYPSLGCMDPLNPDTDGDGLLDGEEDLNHDGHFDFHPGDFDIINYPGGAFTRLIETNPCDPDTDGDGLDDYEERYGIRKSTGRVFPPTNPLDHDTDNDWLLDGEEVDWICEPIYVVLPDPDAHRLPDAGVIEQVITRDDIEYVVRYVPFLDPTNRDSVGDGWLDGLTRDPCNSEPIPIIRPITALPVDTDGDGFSDEDEIASGTDPFDPESYPAAYYGDLDLDSQENDRLWLVDAVGDGRANAVFIDIGANGMVDARVEILYPRDVQVGDFSDGGETSDCRYVISYTFADQRLVMYRWITLVIYDYGCDLVVNQVEATE